MGMHKDGQSEKMWTVTEVRGLAQVSLNHYTILDICRMELGGLNPPAHLSLRGSPEPHTMDSLLGHLREISYSGY